MYEDEKRMACYEVGMYSICKKSKTNLTGDFISCCNPAKVVV